MEQLFVKGKVLARIPFDSWRDGLGKNVWLVVKAGNGIAVCHSGRTAQGFRVLTGNPKLYDTILARFSKPARPKTRRLLQFPQGKPFKDKQKINAAKRINRGKVRHMTGK